MADIRNDEYQSLLSGSQMDTALLDMAEHTSEAWAVGERNGIDVSNIDPTYHNNAKYYAEQAGRVVPEGQAAVRYDIAQALIDSEKAQARSNINTPSDTELLDLKMLGYTVPRNFPAQNYEENGVFHQRVDRVDLGTLTWNRFSVNGRYVFSANLNYVANKTNAFGLCSRYPMSTSTSGYDNIEDKAIIGRSSGTIIYIRDDSYADSATFKASLNGVYLYYELATEITRPIDGGEWAIKYSNPNLLDNWWWGNGVINQRGQTTYTGGGYTIDRWKSNSSGSTLIVSDGYVTLRNAYICQLFEELLPHKTYTFSVLYSSGKISSVTKKVVSDTSSMTFVYDDTIHCTYFPNLKRFDIATTHNPNDVNVVAIKLEEGSVSTLANDSAPNPATELLKCMRYFERIDCQAHPQLYIAYTREATKIMASIPIARKRSETLTISQNLTGYVYTIDQAYSGLGAIEFIGSSSTELRMTVVTATSHATSRPAVLYLVGGHIDISADL